LKGFGRTGNYLGTLYTYIKEGYNKTIDVNEKENLRETFQ